MAEFRYAGIMSQSDPAGATGTLLAHRHVFKAFLASRVGNEADAEDLLQSGLVKAMERSGEIKDGEKAVAWFYQVLRNALIDHMRSRHAAAKRDDAWASSAATLADDREAERHICACFEKMLPAMKPAQPRSPLPWA
jgi:RNA polymerase sigma-70 factor (ECF subfamily)